jgi:hypothetical protein
MAKKNKLNYVYLGIIVVSFGLLLWKNKSKKQLLSEAEQSDEIGGGNGAVGGGSGAFGGGGVPIENKEDVSKEKKEVSLDDVGKESPVFFFTPNTMNEISENGYDFDLKITSNSGWVLSSPSWILLSKTSGTGSTIIRVNVNKTSVAYSRSGEINRIANGVVTNSIIINQTGKIMSTSKPTDVSDANNDTENTGEGTGVATGASVGAGTGVGDTDTGNTGGGDNEAFNMPSSITITGVSSQFPPKAPFNMSTTHAVKPSPLTLSWTATSPDWISLDKKSGTGFAFITTIIKVNSGAIRSGDIVVTTSDGKTASTTINQAGAVNIGTESITNPLTPPYVAPVPANPTTGVGTTNIFGIPQFDLSSVIGSAAAPINNPASNVVSVAQLTGNANSLPKAFTPNNNILNLGEGGIDFSNIKLNVQSSVGGVKNNNVAPSTAYVSPSPVLPTPIIQSNQGVSASMGIPKFDLSAFIGGGNLNSNIKLPSPVLPLNNPIAVKPTIILPSTKPAIKSQPIAVNALTPVQLNKIPINNIRSLKSPTIQSYSGGGTNKIIDGERNSNQFNQL